jgi:hypothetical protein
MKKLEEMTTKELVEYTKTLEQSLTTEQEKNEQLRLAKGDSNAILTPNNPEKCVGEDKDGNPLYEYLIDLPASGGVGITVNGVLYQHGSKYRFTLPQLLSMKEIVHRSWSHEASLHDYNENAYRQEIRPTIRGNERRAR